MLKSTIAAAVLAFSLVTPAQATIFGFGGGCGNRCGTNRSYCPGQVYCQQRCATPCAPRVQCAPVQTCVPVQTCAPVRPACSPCGRY